MSLDALRNRKLEPWLAAGLIVLATMVTYGVLIPQLGFYRDDWYMTWAGQGQGPAGIIQLFRTDRPLIGWTFALLFKFFGANVLLWQIGGLALKALTGLSVLWILRLVWPKKRLETTLAALLFVLYPGFYQQPVAGTFIIDLIGLNAAFVSIALSIYIVKSHNRLMQIIATLLGIALGLLNLGLYEATIGLEVVRWVLVWYVAVGSLKGGEVTSLTAKKNFIAQLQLPRVLKLLWPYFLMLAAFLYWRIFMFTSTRRATNIDVLLGDYASNPLLSVVQVFIGYLKDLFETIVLAWFVPFYQFTAEGSSANFLSALGLALIVMALAGAYGLWFYRQYRDSDEDCPFHRDLLWIGLLAVAIPTGVIVVLGRNVLFGIQWDRYTTQSMFGVGILVTGLIFYFLRRPARWTVLLILIFLAVMTHYHSAAFYRNFWTYERTVWWQLSWRAPDLKDGTTVVVALPKGFRLAEEYEVWGPANMVYSPGAPMRVSGQVPNESLVIDLSKGQTEKRQNRGLSIVRDYSKPLIVSFSSPSSCVHVLDGSLLQLPLSEADDIKEIAPYSQIDLIDVAAQPKTPPVATFGAEPPRTWCYYYQKISLALQARNAAEAASLADEASQKGLSPSDSSEWMPVLTAYANTGQSQKVNQIAKRIKGDHDTRDFLCIQLGKIAKWPNGYNSQVIISSLCGAKN
jgi:hypothetical protein